MEFQSQYGINERLYEVLTQIFHERFTLPMLMCPPVETFSLDLFTFNSWCTAWCDLGFDIWKDSTNDESKGLISAVSRVSPLLPAWYSRLHLRHHQQRLHPHPPGPAAPGECYYRLPAQWTAFEPCYCRGFFLFFFFLFLIQGLKFKCINFFWAHDGGILNLELVSSQLLDSLL